MIKHVIIYARTADELDRLTKFLSDNEDHYTFVRDYIRAGGTIRDRGGVYSCISEKAQFKIRLMFESRDYVV